MWQMQLYRVELHQMGQQHHVRRRRLHSRIRQRPGKMANSPRRRRGPQVPPDTVVYAEAASKHVPQLAEEMSSLCYCIWMLVDTMWS